MRGDRPAREMAFPETLEFTPHARGSTELGLQTISKADVYPACAGIDLIWAGSTSSCLSLPRMRGDRPPFQERITEEKRFTPHARGSTPSDSW